MTATPRYFTGRVVREAKTADFEVASMDDEAAFGPVLHRLGFAEAIERDLLTDYQVPNPLMIITNGTQSCS